MAKMKWQVEARPLFQQHLPDDIESLVVEVEASCAEEALSLAALKKFSKRPEDLTEKDCDDAIRMWTEAKRQWFPQNSPTG